MRQITAGQIIRTVFVLLFFSAFFFSLTGWPAAALTPEEKLADPILEDRARALSKQLRCLVCQNQSIDDSDADLAKDLRREVRSLLQTGASDAAFWRVSRTAMVIMCCYVPLYQHKLCCYGWPLR